MQSEAASEGLQLALRLPLLIDAVEAGKKQREDSSVMMRGLGAAYAEVSVMTLDDAL